MRYEIAFVGFNRTSVLGSNLGLNRQSGMRLITFSMAMGGVLVNRTDFYKFDTSCGFKLYRPMSSVAHALGWPRQ